MYKTHVKTNDNGLIWEDFERTPQLRLGINGSIYQESKIFSMWNATNGREICEEEYNDVKPAIIYCNNMKYFKIVEYEQPFSLEIVNPHVRRPITECGTQFWEYFSFWWGGDK